MLRIASKNQTRQRVHDRIRKKVIGTAERPRLNVYRGVARDLHSSFFPKPGEWCHAAPA